MAFYKLLLERENMHIFKRYYLLTTLLLSCCIPLVTFTNYVPASAITSLVTVQDTLPITRAQPTTIETINYLPTALWSIYGLGVIFFGLIFIKNLRKIFNTIHENAKVKEHEFTNVLLDKFIVPHTFLSYIFLNKEAFTTQKIPKEVLWHEQIHAKQKHSIDILIIEFFQVLFWFHPLVYIIKKNIKLNHEFLADKGVLSKGVSTANYQELLLTFSSNVQHHQLANAINYSSIKKRFTVMKTQTSKHMTWLKVFVIIPLVAIMLYGFSETVTLVENEKISTLNAIDINQGKASEVIILNSPPKEIYYKDAVFRYKDENGTSVIKTYEELTEKEKKNLPTPPGIPAKRSPSKKELQSWLNTSQFGVWVDGERIENATLNSYKSSDFDLYVVSKLAKNAVNYGKHYYQVVLSTKANYIERYAKGVRPLPKGAMVSIGAPKKAVKVTQEKVTPKMIATYNQLAKKYNKQSETKNYRIKGREVEKMTYIYELMTDVQKENAEPFPNIPPPPPPPPAPKAPEKSKNSNKPTHIEIPEVKAPKKVVKTLTEEELRENETGYTKVNGKTLYYTTKNGKISYYDRFGERVDSKGEKLPPPPPPPVSLTKYLKKYKDETSSYYFNDKEITYAQAIELAEKRKGESTHMTTNKGKDDKYIVKLYDKPLE